MKITKKKMMFKATIYVINRPPSLMNHFKLLMNQVKLGRYQVLCVKYLVENHSGRQGRNREVNMSACELFLLLLPSRGSGVGFINYFERLLQSSIFKGTAPKTKTCRYYQIVEDRESPLIPGFPPIQT